MFSVLGWIYEYENMETTIGRMDCVDRAKADLTHPDYLEFLDMLGLPKPELD